MVSRLRKSLRPVLSFAALSSCLSSQSFQSRWWSMSSVAWYYRSRVGASTCTATSACAQAGLSGPTCDSGPSWGDRQGASAPPSGTQEEPLPRDAARGVRRPGADQPPVAHRVPGELGRHVVHETIYQALYLQGRGMSAIVVRSPADRNRAEITVGRSGVIDGSC